MFVVRRSLCVRRHRSNLLKSSSILTSLLKAYGDDFCLYLYHFKADKNVELYKLAANLSWQQMWFLFQREFLHGSLIIQISIYHWLVFIRYAALYLYYGEPVTMAPAESADDDTCTIEAIPVADHQSIFRFISYVLSPRESNQECMYSSLFAQFSGGDMKLFISRGMRENISSYFRIKWSHLQFYAWPGGAIFGEDYISVVSFVKWGLWCESITEKW